MTTRPGSLGRWGGTAQWCAQRADRACALRMHGSTPSSCAPKPRRGPRIMCRVDTGADAPRAKLGASMAWMVDGLDAQAYLPAAQRACAPVRPGGVPDAQAPTTRASVPRRRGGSTTCQARLGTLRALAGSLALSSRTRRHARYATCSPAPRASALHATRDGSMSLLRLAPLGAPTARRSAAAAGAAALTGQSQAQARS